MSHQCECRSQITNEHFALKKHFENKPLEERPETVILVATVEQYSFSTIALIRQSPRDVSFKPYPEKQMSCIHHMVGKSPIKALKDHSTFEGAVER